MGREMGNICNTISNKKYIKIKRSGESVAPSAGRFWGSKKGEAGDRRLGGGQEGHRGGLQEPLNTRGHPGSPLSWQRCWDTYSRHHVSEMWGPSPTFLSSGPRLWRWDTNYRLAMTLLAWD